MAPLVGRRFLCVSGRTPLKLSKLYDWDWRAGWIRAATSTDLADEELQVLLEFDEKSWRERDWYNIHNPPQGRTVDKRVVSARKKKRKKGGPESSDSKDEEAVEAGEEVEEFQLFLVEERLTVAHRPNSQGSSATTGTLYPALVYSPLVDKVDMFKTKKLPVEFLSDNKLVFQEYSHLRTIKEWDPTLPGLAVCERSRREVLRWAEQRAGQQILLTTPTVLVGYRAEVYRVEGTTQWYSAVIVGYSQETGEFTVTDDTVLEEHCENPTLVQMRILGEGVIESILGGEDISVAPRRSRASVYRHAHSLLPHREKRGAVARNQRALHRTTGTIH